MRAYEFINENDIQEQTPAKNAYALTGSGRGGNTKKPNVDSPAHKKLYPPGTNYPVSQKKYKTGANPGFVG